MSIWRNYPVVYEINTWFWLKDLSEATGRSITLANIPDAELQRLADYRFDALWLMGVWQRSQRAREIAIERPELKPVYRRLLPDYTEADVAGSPYAISSYQVEPAFGGDEALANLRERLTRLGLNLMLDFVPNHMAIDHPWVTEYPERMVAGTAEQLQAEPYNYFTTATNGQAWILAYGRDPYFKGWPDTVQLDYRRAETRQVMTDTLLSIAARCDGVRCDMAMLVLHDIFTRTWGGQFDRPGVEFWAEAIATVKAQQPSFLMLAEAYWDLEHYLQQLGFDYTYDKRLYDRLKYEGAEEVRGHLTASLDYQRRLCRFVENHDEERAMAAFGPQMNPAATTLALTLPGLRLWHEGQIEGRALKLPVELGRRPQEALAPAEQQVLARFHSQLLAALAAEVFHDGDWRLLEPHPAWDGNSSYHHFVGFHWVQGDEIRLVVVNLSRDWGQCYFPLQIGELAGREWDLIDQLSQAQYRRHGDQLLNPGLYLDMPGYGYHLFELRPV